MRARFRHTIIAVALLAVGPAAAQDPPLPGVCFGPFRAGESPGGRSPLPSALCADLDTVAKLAARVRTYGMGGTGLLVAELCDARGIECWPGAWIGSDRAVNDLECELVVHVAERFPRAVETVLVGNEVILRGDLDVASLARRIAAVRDAVEQPVGTAEPWHVWLAHPELVKAVEVLVVHVHPYWDEVSAAGAAAHTLDKIAAVRAVAGDKPVVLGEFGWPTAGDARGAAVPSPANAARYLRDVLPKLRARDEPFFVFEMWDEAWKAGAEGTVGPHWGLFRSDGGPKPELVDAIPDLMAAKSVRPPRPTGDERRAGGSGR